MINYPLKDLFVLDFSQFLSGPSAGLRLADLGARVVKVERPNTGDICRTLYVSNVVVAGESTLFHAINRNKESYVADLKASADYQKIRQLIEQADVLIHNFRPCVMERLKLSYDLVRTWNPQLIYADISGYGQQGSWHGRPGQDLLAQAVSGLTHLTGNRDSPPTPMGVSVGDLLAGVHLVQGILAALVQRTQTKQGSFVQVSLLESLLDFQFEVFTDYLNDQEHVPKRGMTNSAHAYLAAPYGVYATADGHIALSIAPPTRLAVLLDCPALQTFDQPHQGYAERDAIRVVLAGHLTLASTAYWLSRLEPAGIWCADVLDYERLTQQPAYQHLDMEQILYAGEQTLTTTRCPIRLDDQRLVSPRAAPRLGEHTDAINQEFSLVNV